MAFKNSCPKHFNRVWHENAKDFHPTPYQNSIFKIGKNRFICAGLGLVLHLLLVVPLSFKAVSSLCHQLWFQLQSQWTLPLRFAKECHKNSKLWTLSQPHKSSLSSANIGPQFDFKSLHFFKHSLGQEGWLSRPITPFWDRDPCLAVLFCWWVPLTYWPSTNFDASIEVRGLCHSAPLGFLDGKQVEQIRCQCRIQIPCIWKGIVFQNPDWPSILPGKACARKA